MQFWVETKTPNS